MRLLSLAVKEMVDYLEQDYLQWQDFCERLRKSYDLNTDDLLWVIEVSKRRVIEGKQRNARKQT